MRSSLVALAALALCACRNVSDKSAPVTSPPDAAQKSDKSDKSDKGKLVVAPPTSMPGCISPTLHAQGAVTAYALEGDVISFCASDTGDSPITSCRTLDLAHGVFGLWGGPSNKPPTLPEFHHDGVVLTPGEDSVVVCASGGKCNTVKLKGFVRASDSLPPAIVAHVPASESPDGKRLFVVRHEGGPSEKIFGEVYDVGSGTKLSRAPIEADAHVDRVAWLGKRVFIETCVDAGPGCSGFLIDPATGKEQRLDANFYGVDRPVHHAHDDVFAFVEDAGRRVTFRHEGDGAIDQTLELVPETNIENGASVVEHGGQLAVIEGGPNAGDVVVIDLATASIKQRLSVPLCKEP